jgi:hypothetical protein
LLFSVVVRLRCFATLADVCRRYKCSPARFSLLSTMSMSTMAIGEEGPPQTFPGGPTPAPPAGPTVVPCPLCQRPTAVVALEAHIHDCLNGLSHKHSFLHPFLALMDVTLMSGATGAGSKPAVATVDEDKKQYDLEIERLRVARQAAIAEVSSFSFISSSFLALRYLMLFLS